MAKRRRFTAKFKAEVVLEALSGQSSQAELCRRHNLSENQVSTWKRQLLENVETLILIEVRDPGKNQMYTLLSRLFWGLYLRL